MRFIFDGSKFFYRMLFALAAFLAAPTFASAQGGGSSCMFTPAINYSVSDRSRSVALGDLDGDLDLDLAGDLDLDLAVAKHSGDVSVLLNDCILLGDVNLDGVVDLLDVAPFVDPLISGNFQAEADINQDGVVDLLDIAPFVDLLTG